MRQATLTFLLLLFAIPSMAQEIAPVVPGDRLTAHVIHVTDGDSLEVELRGLRMRVRLSGVNCPEWNKPGGKEATAFAKAWIAHGQIVELEVAQDCFTTKPDCWDKYNRLLAFVWRDGEMLQEELLKSGNAEVKYINKTDKYYERFVAAKE
ncbi:MAG: thermonuclease family protein [Pseudodesulfovibrio sp.]|nr:thermonuclease family protein [Pseudodesulfovibrio sp.]